MLVLFLSPPETPRISCVPTFKTSQSEQPSIYLFSLYVLSSYTFEEGKKTLKKYLDSRYI